jgi:hypothetical protein
MALPSFTGLSPAATRGYILHISSASLSSAPVYTGAGNVTPLAFVTGGISITGDVAAATVTTSGNITTNGVVIKPAQWKILSGTVTATDTTPVAISDFSFTPVNGATYEVEIMMVVTSASTGAGVQLSNTGGSGTLYLGGPSETAAIVATGGNYAPTSAPVANTKFVILLKGTFTASATTALTWSIKSETTDDVSIYAGSYAKFTRIAN